MNSEQHSTTVSIVPSAAQSEEFARVNQRMDVHDYLPRTFHDGTAQANKCEWSSHVVTKLTPDESGALAWVLIEEIMKDRFGCAKDLYDTWRKCTLEGVHLSPQKKKVIESFVAPVFGLPSAPKDRNHLHGYLGEWIWHLLTRNNRAVRYQSTPKSEVTGGGGDGFSIYENAQGELRFRLWESKKNTGVNPRIKSKIGEACNQLESEGQRYVALFIGMRSSEVMSKEEEILIEGLADAWAERSEIVGAGTALSTHHPLPKAPFDGTSKILTGFDKPGQLRGLAVSISCYCDLAETVRRYAWTAL